MDPIQEVRNTLIALDRASVRAEGFYKFCGLAWEYTKPGEPAFVPGWHLEEMCVHAEALTPPWHAPDCPCGRCEKYKTPAYQRDPKVKWHEPLIRRFVCNVPPSCTKSKIWSVLWPAWVWTWRPEFRWIMTSYADNVVHDLAKQHFDLVTSSWYVQRWPHARLEAKGKHAMGDFRTAAGGMRYSVTTGGQVTGRHANALVNDDPVQPADVNADSTDTAGLEFARRFDQAVAASRSIDAKTFVRATIGQRVHEADPSGAAIADGAIALVLPMLFEPENACHTPFGGDRRAVEGETINEARWPRLEADRTAKGMGGWSSATAQAQLQQRTAPPGGLIFKRDWMQHFDREATPIRKTYSCLVVDCNFKEAETSSDIGLAVLGAQLPRLYVYDGRSERGGFLRTIELVGELVRKWHPNAILIDDKANGSALIELLKKHFPNVIAVKAEDSKEARGWAASTYYEARSVYHELAVCQVLDDAMATFPRGRKKDLPDAIIHGLIWLAKRDTTAFKRAVEAWDRQGAALALGLVKD